MSQSTSYWLRLVRAIDALNEWVGRAVSWGNTLLVLVICYDVLMRYVFNRSQVAIMEIEWHLFAVVFLLGAAYAFKHDRHVRVDVFYANFSAKRKALINVLGILLFLIPFCWIVIRSGWEFTSNSLKIGERSPDPGGLPARYLIKSAIPLGFLLLLLQACAELIKSFLILLDRSHPESPSQP
ncbi:TRAP-type mannitol/chloroaromatic compound transport system, small permease component [Catalinimonas alkaloidigena]|uniref:TRAP-type mannitol/chloroaromatic compound transport system, small permease component n=1 Tax=Catalinimonas alkaloidigena TaxID=1075417 RepID=A0A1G9PIG0_9BACT|nr:TRAP transporter small permease subunit [Catalinimonas alkaloidigena]SDL98642.1 TRAP-type mannitol/chloroaromatic compound transport system, small permease component [Catalinimonas alkaloidigena]